MRLLSKLSFEQYLKCRICFVDTDHNFLFEVPLIVDESAQFQISPEYIAKGVGQNDAAQPTSFESRSQPEKPFSRVHLDCIGYIAKTVRWFHDKEKSFDADFEKSAPRLELALRARYMAASSVGREANKMHLHAIKLCQRYSMYELKRQARVDSTRTELIMASKDKWRALSAILRSEGGPWENAERKSAFKYWKIADAETAQRKRRKLVLCSEGSDHRKATQDYLDQNSSSVGEKVLKRARRKVGGAHLKSTPLQRLTPASSFTAAATDSSGTGVLPGGSAKVSLPVLSESEQPAETESLAIDGHYHEDEIAVRNGEEQMTTEERLTRLLSVTFDSLSGGNLEGAKFDADTVGNTEGKIEKEVGVPIEGVRDNELQSTDADLSDSELLDAADVVTDGVL